MSIVVREADINAYKGNYLDRLAEDIYTVDPRIKNKQTTFACASALLGCLLPNVRIATRVGHPLSLCEMNFFIGSSGVGKTIPFNELRRLIEGLTIEGHSLLLPSRFTTEGLEDYFARQDEDGEYIYPNIGIMLIDEISQMFSEAKHKKHLSGTIEEIARLYDHNLPTTALVSGVRQPRNPYISFIGATVPENLHKIDDSFFQTGEAGRMFWVNCDSDNTKLDGISISEKDVDVSNKRLKLHISLLQDLIRRNPKNIEYIYIQPEADKVWLNYSNKANDEWEYGRATNRFGWDYQYKKRLAEMAIKQAGRYAIGRCFNRLIREKSDKPLNVCITVEDMTKGIVRTNLCDMNLAEIMVLRREAIAYQKNSKKLSFTKNPEVAVLLALKNAINKTMNSTQLFSESGISNYQEFQSILIKHIKDGKILEVDKKTITNLRERNRLTADHNRTKIYQLKQ